MKNQLKQIGLIAFITFVFFSCKKESSIISVTGITISQTSYVVNIGATDTIKASVNPLNATNKDVSWSSSNTSFVSINSSGVVTGVALGTATITATTSDGNKTATCIVNVIASVTGITVLPKIISLNIGNSDTIKAVLTPSNASNKNVSWESSNTAIATVSSLGVVTGIAFGNVLITATTADGNKTATCNVTITKWTTYKRSNGLASDTVWTIATEAQGNVWLGGSDEKEAGGISEFNGSSWKTYTRSNSGLIDNTVNTIAIDGQNNKWVGCGIATSGVSKFDGTNWTSYTKANSGLIDNIVLCSAIDNQGSKWIGTLSGVSKFDGTNWTSYTTTNSGLVYNYIFSIAIDAQGNKWFGTWNGVSKFDGTNWTTFLGGTWIHAIAVDASGNKWFGTENGISKFDGTNWVTFTTSNSGLANNQVRSIAMDKQGNMWFGTLGGVSKFDGNNWITYNTSNSGLTNNLVYSIGIDSKGNKWFGTFGGVSELQDSN